MSTRNRFIHDNTSYERRETTPSETSDELSHPSFLKEQVRHLDEFLENQSWPGDDSTIVDDDDLMDDADRVVGAEQLLQQELEAVDTLSSIMLKAQFDMGQKFNWELLESEDKRTDSSCTLSTEESDDNSKSAKLSKESRQGSPQPALIKASKVNGDVETNDHCVEKHHTKSPLLTYPRNNGFSHEYLVQSDDERTNLSCTRSTDESDESRKKHRIDDKKTNLSFAPSSDESDENKKLANLSMDHSNEWPTYDPEACTEVKSNPRTNSFKPSGILEPGYFRGHGNDVPSFVDLSSMREASSQECQESEITMETSGSENFDTGKMIRHFFFMEESERSSEKAKRVLRFKMAKEENSLEEECDRCFDLSLGKEQGLSVSVHESTQKEPLSNTRIDFVAKNRQRSESEGNTLRAHPQQENKLYPGKCGYEIEAATKTYIHSNRRQKHYEATIARAEEWNAFRDTKKAGPCVAKEEVNFHCIVSWKTILILMVCLFFATGIIVSVISFGQKKAL